MKMVERSNLADRVFHELRQEILTCRLKPGSKLNIKSICDRFEISLGAVREALSRLYVEKLVVSEPQKGFRVAYVSQNELEDISLARIFIEKECLRRSIEFGDLDWESQVIAAFHRLSHTPEGTSDEEHLLNKDWIAAHYTFHEALTAACNSEWLLNIRKMLYEQSERYRNFSFVLDPKEDRAVQEEHKAIMDATLTRKSEKAMQLMEQHLAKTTQIIIANHSLPKENAAA
jgi:DNA-binding GntR family transcriptional regulator